MERGREEERGRVGRQEDRIRREGGESRRK